MIRLWTEIETEDKCKRTHSLRCETDSLRILEELTSKKLR